MLDLTQEMAGLYQTLNPRKGRGRVILFAGALEGEGVSTVAREYARCAAAMADKPVWLIDADLKKQEQLEAVRGDAARFGPAGPLSQASPDGSMFFQVTPAGHDASGVKLTDADYLAARPFLENRLWVTQIRQDELKPAQRLSILENGPYFEALRRHTEAVIIDAPAFERSKDVLTLAAQADAVIMVVAEDRGTLAQRLEARDALAAVGAKLMGVVYNRAREVIEI